MPLWVQPLASSHLACLWQPFEPECQTRWDHALEMWRPLHHSLHGQPIRPCGDLIRRARLLLRRHVLSEQHCPSICLVDVTPVRSVYWSRRAPDAVERTAEHQPAILQRDSQTRGHSFGFLYFWSSDFIWCQTLHGVRMRNGQLPWKKMQTSRSCSIKHSRAGTVGMGGGGVKFF